MASWGLGGRVPAGLRPSKRVSSEIDASCLAAADVSVHLRCRGGGMPEQLLDDAQVGAPVEEVRRVAVAQRVSIPFWQIKTFAPIS